jgi:ATP-binding cassette subfamily B protein
MGSLTVFRRETMARNKYDVDEEIHEKLNMQSLRRLGSYILPYKWQMLFVLVTRAMASVGTLLLPKFLQVILDEYLPMGEAGIPYIVRLSLISVGILLYVSAAIAVKTKIMMWAGQEIVANMREDLFVHLQELPFDYYDSRPHGKIQVRLVNYINNLSDLLSNGIVNTLLDFITLVVILVFMFAADVRFTLVCLCGLPVMILIVALVKKGQRRAWQQASAKQSNLNAYIAESINGIQVTQSFVREKKNTGIFNKLSRSYRKAWLHAIKYNLILPPSVDMLSVITTAFIYVLGVRWLSGGNPSITVGVIVLFTSYISRFWTPITNMGSFYNSLLTAMSYLEMIFETMDEPVKVQDKETAFPMPPVKGDVEFRDVHFSYEEGPEILKGISFRAKAGETVAIVGPTGAGKTTIINLLSRFYNLGSGQITIDGISIEEVTMLSLRKQMGVMLQDSFLFSGTIMENIRYGNRTATDADVEQAAKVVCAHDFIMRMENGYQTQVNERGSRLSMGQRQLIAFARALLADPAILILDEATASIDTETEIALQQGLNQLLKGRTSFIIAHRLSTIKNANFILYIEDGRILEQGSHRELIEKKGAYYQLYMSQYQI